MPWEQVTMPGHLRSRLIRSEYRPSRHKVIHPESSPLRDRKEITVFPAADTFYSWETRSLDASASCVLPHKPVSCLQHHVAIQFASSYC